MGSSALESGAAAGAIDVVRELAPASWRAPTGHQSLPVARDVAATVTHVLSNEYAWYRGGCAAGCDGDGFPTARPWEDFADWELFVETLARLVRESGHPGDWYDLWNEPDNPSHWAGTLDQLVETLARGALAVRRGDPAARIVGPSFVAFASQRFAANDTLAVLAGLATHDIRLDAISWHAFEHPDVVANQSSTLRAFLVAHPTLGAPVIHLDEYASAEVHQLPGWHVAFAKAFADGDVAAVALACWDVRTLADALWSSCDRGLNGLLLADELTPTVLYWTQLVLGAIGDHHVRVEHGAGDCRGVAAFIAPERLVVVAGRAGIADQRALGTLGQPISVTIAIEGLPWEGVSRVTRTRLAADLVPIPSDPAIFYNVAHPDSPSAEVSVNLPSGEHLRIDDFADGDAYIFVVEPSR